MADLSQYSDADLKSMYLQSLPDADLQQLQQQSAPLSSPSSWSDTGKSLVGGVERGTAAVPMILPNLLNAAAAGPQELYRGMTGRNNDNSPLWQPFMGSEDVLQKLAPELRPHEPQSPAGAVANMVGQLIGGAGVAKTAEGLGGVIEPFSQSGRDQIANRVLYNQADNPTQAASNLQNVPQYIPGSQATGGTASGDLGLIGTEKTLMQNPANYFGARLADQNTARTNMINQVAGNDTTIPNYEAIREAATAPLYRDAQGVIADPKAFADVLNNTNMKINEVGPYSAAGGTLGSIKSAIQKTLGGTPESNQYFTANEPVPSPVPDSQLMQLYRENRDALNKTAMQPGAYGSSVKGAITPINVQLGKAIEAQNPAFAKAQDMFSQFSTPIDQAKNMQALVPQMTGGVEDLQGQNIFSPAKVGAIMKNGEMKTEYNGVQPLSEALSPEQHQALQALNSDLQRSNAVNIPMVRPPGSNTFNNAASTADLTNSLAAKTMEYIPGFKGAYQAQNPKIMQAIADKMLSPEQLRQAMLNGNPTSKTLGALLASGALYSPNYGGNHQ